MANPKEFLRFNEFYMRPDQRSVIFKLYKGICQGCHDDLRGRIDYDTGHILPRSKPEVFEELFPGLDVDNLLNLHLQCQKCNRGISNSFADSPLLFHHSYSYSARMITSRIDKVLKEDLLDVDFVSYYFSRLISANWNDAYKDGVCYDDYHKLPLQALEDSILNAVTKYGIETTQHGAALEYYLRKSFDDNKHEYLIAYSDGSSGFSYSHSKCKLETVAKEIEDRFHASHQANATRPKNLNDWVYLSGPLNKSYLPPEVTWNTENERAVNNLIKTYRWCESLIFNKKYRLDKKHIAFYDCPEIDIVSLWFGDYTSFFNYLDGFTKNEKQLLPSLDYVCIEKHEFSMGGGGKIDLDEIDIFIGKMKRKNMDSNYCIVLSRQIKSLQKRIGKIILSLQTQISIAA